MIFRHYRTWIPGLNPNAGAKVGRILGGIGGGNTPPSAFFVASPAPEKSVETQRDQLLSKWRRGESNRARAEDRGEESSSSADFATVTLPCFTVVYRSIVPEGQSLRFEA
jgi:hypothetical protein